MFKHNRLIGISWASGGGSSSSRSLGGVSSQTGGFSGGSGGGVSSSGQRNTSYDTSGGALAGQDPGLLSAAAMMFSTADGRDSAISELKARDLWQEPTAQDYARLSDSGDFDSIKTSLQGGMTEEMVKFGLVG